MCTSDIDFSSSSLCHTGTSSSTSTDNNNNNNKEEEEEEVEEEVGIIIPKGLFSDGAT